MNCKNKIILTLGYNISSIDFYKDIAQELNLGHFISENIIQTLWGGYGELKRVEFSFKTVIIKHIKLPKPSSHPKGWNTNTSHKRKLHSYQVEVNWYEHFSKTIDNKCPIPKGLKTFQNENQWLIIMEDLSNFGFNKTTLDGNKKQIISCLKWLANFHGKYMNKKSDILWKIGTYWHLDTRWDEYEALDDKILKESAKEIDTILNSCKYQTIVHGDAKIANFCFNKSGNLCAAVDFQYVGHGCGMKDVAYFMSSAIEPKKCFEYEEFILNTYFEELEKALNHYQIKIDYKDLKKEWTIMFYFAWADFTRFLKGWSPNHYKIDSYSNQLTKNILKTLI